MPASIPVGRYTLRPPPGLGGPELRKWLAVACALDRARLQLSVRPKPLRGVPLSLLENVIPLAPQLPGAIGRWSRGILQGTNILRSVYTSMFS